MEAKRLERPISVPIVYLNCVEAPTRSAEGIAARGKISENQHEIMINPWIRKFFISQSIIRHCFIFLQRPNMRTALQRSFSTLDSTRGPAMRALYNTNICVHNIYWGGPDAFTRRTYRSHFLAWHVCHSRSDFYIACKYPCMTRPRHMFREPWSEGFHRSPGCP